MKKPVTFLRPHPPYMPGETAGFDHHVSDKLVKDGIARAVITDLADQSDSTAAARLKTAELGIPSFVVKKNGSKFDVVDKAGKAQNAEPLKKADAEALAAELNAPKPTGSFAITRGEGDALEYFGGLDEAKTPRWTKDRAAALMSSDRTLAEETMKGLEGDLSIADLTGQPLA